MKVIYANSRFLITKPGKFRIAWRRDSRLYCLSLGPYDFVMRRGERLDIPPALCRSISKLALGDRS